MIKTKTFYFNDLRECTYVVWDDTRECVIIDPGCQSDSERERLKKFIETNNLKPVKLLNTHGHFDHVMEMLLCKDVGCSRHTLIHRINPN